MSKQKELLKNTGIIGIGTLSSKIVAFLLLPLYVSILSAAEFGTVDLLLSYIQLLIPVANLELGQALFRFLVGNRLVRSECKTIISTVFYFTLINLFIFSLLFFVIQFFVSIPFKCYFLLIIICFILSGFISSCARGLGNNVNYSVQNFIGVLTNIIFNIIFLVFLEFGITGLLLSYILSSIISGIYGFISNRVYSYISFAAVERKRIKEFYSYSIPLIPNQLSWWIMKASDRTVINLFISVAANGIIAVASKFSNAYILVYNLFNLAWAESVVLHVNDKDGKEYIEETINTTFSLFSSICFGIISFMPFVFNLFVPNPEYAEAFNLIPIYMISALFNVVVGLYSAIYIAFKNTKAVAITSGLSSFLNLVVDLAVVKFIGIYAAPISSLVGFAVMMFYRYYHSRKYIVVKIHTKTLFAAVIIGIISIVLYYSKNSVGNIISAMICVVYAIYGNKRLINGLKNYITNRG